MPDSKYTGSPSGSGNPPGKYSDAYLSSNSGMSGSHFVDDASYRGNMHIGGIVSSPPVVGNQPKQNSDSSIESFANKEDSIQYLNIKTVQLMGVLQGLLWLRTVSTVAS